MLRLNFGTGTFHKLKVPSIQQRSILSKLPIDGVEFCAAKLVEIDELLTDTDHLQFLQQYPANTLHAPFLDNFLITKQNASVYLPKILLLARKLKAKNVVFHLYNIESPLILNSFPFPYSFENTLSGDWHSHKLIDFFSLNSFNMTFDTAHALHFGQAEYDLLVKHLAQRVSQVHLSCVIEARHHRQFTHLPNSFEYAKSLLTPLISTQPIITIEENFSSVDEIQEEVMLLRSLVDELNMC